MTDRERMLAIMRHEPVDRAMWQPRLEHWYFTNKRLGRLPERYRDMSLVELYDDLGCSIRAYHFYGPCIRVVRGEGVSYETVEDTPKRTVHLWKTPVGTLRSVTQKTAESSLCREFPVKTIEDLKVIEYSLRTRRFEFDHAMFAEAERTIGDRGAPTAFNQRIPIQRLIIELMGFEPTMFALHDYPREMEAFMRLVEETDDAFYDVFKACPMEIYNFGDNVDSTMLPPPLMRKYALPYYQRRNAELHAAGKRTYPHWDGALKGLMPFVRECGFDGYEAFTPQPMGDITLEEIAEAMGHDYVLVDGIPATHFLAPFTMDDVEEFAVKVLDMFAPSLILGISDELPPPGDIERVRLVSEIVRDYRPR